MLKTDTQQLAQNEASATTDEATAAKNATTTSGSVAGSPMSPSIGMPIVTQQQQQQQQMMTMMLGAMLSPAQFYAAASNIPQSVQVPVHFTAAVVAAPPLPPPENTIYVNRHQYERIVKRRESRRVLDAYYNRCRKGKKRGHPNYKHESRHRHALNRPRNRMGHFMKGSELEDYYRNNPDKAPPNLISSSKASHYDRQKGNRHHHPTVNLSKQPGGKAL